MAINPEYENEVRLLLKQNKRFEAVRYLQNTLNVSNTDADRLVQAVENEIALEKQQVLNPAAETAKGCGSMVIKVISFGFGFFGVVFILIGIGAYLLFNYIEADAVEVQGHVVDLRPSPNGGDGFAPVIEYEWNGQTKTHQSEVYSSPPDFETGQMVPVYVNPSNPDIVTIIYEETGWIFISVFGGIGAVFIVIAIVLFRFGKKMNRPL
ncbi:MAG: DUF3592 domain-containing protein [Flammeovirgaceae bacterium]|nr:MAG: DUF3592 domain-containing protein [Flammeovirgaceae bacterium]